MKIRNIITSRLLYLFFGIITLQIPLCSIAQNKIVSEENEEDENGAHRQKLFFERLHLPVENPGADYFIELADQISKMPHENQYLKVQTVNNWKYFGADGVKINLGNSKLSGRITNFEMLNGNNQSLRVMSASGGLWRFTGGPNPVPVSMSDNLSSLWGGAFATDPNDSNIVFIGTGEPASHGGTGLFKTTDGGQNWQPLTMTPTPSEFYRLFFTPGNTQIIHAATSHGYYRSNDNGVTWVRKFFYNSGYCSDLVINAQNPNILYAAYWKHGIYKSIDGGDNWTLLTGGIPITNIGRTALAIGTINPDVVYVNMTNDNDNTTKGIYKSTDGGVSWVTCVYGNDLSGNPGNGKFHSNQGWYNNVISVCPTNDNIVLAGGVGMWRSTDGITFSEIDPLHSDQHAIVWNPNGSDVFIGNDGGVFYSIDAGFSFSTLFVSKYNSLPVSQYYHFSIGKTNAHVVAGTTQDNGFHYKSYATGGIWNCKGGGDGSGVAVDPLDSNVLIYGNGVFGGALQSHRFVSLNGGSTFNNADQGIDTCGDWFPELRISPVLNIYYTACERNVYYSNNQGGLWGLLNPANAFVGDVWDFTVSNDAVSDPTVYACLQNGVNVKLMVYDGLSQAWYNRSAGLPANTYIRKVAVDILNGDIAYALAGGLPSNGAGNKVFKTTDRGQTWTNISGNLPNVAVTDLIAYPGNPSLLYLGSESGAFKTTDGGITWSTWTNGMPPGALINEFDYVDSLAVNGTFYVAACTYGRGIWIREVSGDDPAGIKEVKPDQLSLAQNTDNPGTGFTKIVYAIGKNAHVKLSITDIAGKVIADLVNENQTKGKHEILFDRSTLKAGIYFYKLSVDANSISKKMVVTR